jgi:hypothetical protein
MHDRAQYWAAARLLRNTVLNYMSSVRSEVYTTVSEKNNVFWDVMLFSLLVYMTSHPRKPVVYRSCI